MTQTFIGSRHLPLMSTHQIRETARGIWQLVIGPMLAEFFSLMVCLFVIWFASLILIGVTPEPFGDFVIQIIRFVASTIVPIYVLVTFVAGMASFVTSSGLHGLQPKLFQTVVIPLLVPRSK